MTTTTGPRSLTGRLKHSLLRVEAGAAGGLAAAVGVAAVFLMQGAIRMEPLAVPTALTTAWFGGAESGAWSSIGLGPDVVHILQFLTYSFLHVLTFTAVGMSAAFIVGGAKFWNSVMGGALYVGAGCTGILYLAGRMAATPVALDVLGLPSVVGANMLAGGIIGAALYVVEHGDDKDASA